jgi:hypothetical protein
VLHNTQGQKLEILAWDQGNKYLVYTLNDADNTPSFSASYPLLSTSVSGNNQRATMADTGPSQWVAVIGYQDANAVNRAGVVLASTASPGPYTEVCPANGCTMDQWPVGDNPIIVIGNQAYRFVSTNFPSATPVYQWRWSLDPMNFKSDTRNDIGSGVLPVASVALDANGTQQLLTASALTSADGGFTGFSLSLATISAGNFFTFTSADLKPFFTPTIGDLFGVNSPPALAVYPGRIALFTQGALPTSTGLNFWLFDATNAKVLAQRTGTGQNLLQGKTNIKMVAAEYAPNVLGGTNFDVAWIEHETPPTGAPYDAIFYETLQCAN